MKMNTLSFLLSLACALCLCTALRVDDEQSPLNLALGAAVDQINGDGTIDRLFTEFYGSTPIPVPDTCTKTFPTADLIPADSDLNRVLTSGVLRVGVAAVAAGKPIIFSDVEPGTDLTQGNLSGIEIEEARAAAKAIGDHYGKTLTVEFVILPPGADPFFGTLVDALEDRKVDIVWSRMTNTDERAKRVDFSCNNFKTNFVIGTGPGVSTTLPLQAGAPNTVACTAIFCTRALPEGSGLVYRSYDSLEEANQALLTGVDPFVAGSQEQLQLVYQANSCTTCGILQDVILGENIWSPSTRRLEVPKTVSAVVSVAKKHAADLLALLANASAARKAAVAVEAKEALLTYKLRCAAYPSVKVACRKSFSKDFKHVVTAAKA